MTHPTPTPVTRASAEPDPVAVARANPRAEKPSVPDADPLAVAREWLPRLPMAARGMLTKLITLAEIQSQELQACIPEHIALTTRIRQLEAVIDECTCPRDCGTCQGCGFESAGITCGPCGGSGLRQARDDGAEELEWFRELAREHTSDQYAEDELVDALSSLLTGYAAEEEEHTRTAGLLADICGAAFGDPQRAEVHGYAGVLEQVRYLVAAKDFDRNGNWEPTLCGNGYRHKPSGGTAFPCDGRWDIDCGKGVCISAGGHYRTLAEAAAGVERLARAPTPPREAVPAAVVTSGVMWPALPDGYEWKPTGTATAGFSLVYARFGGRLGRAWEDGGWFADGGKPEQATPPTLAAAQAALVAELTRRGVLPAVPQPVAAGEAEPWVALVRAAVVRLDFARGFGENSRRLNNQLHEVAWNLHEALGDDTADEHEPADAVPQPDGGASGEADPHGLGAGWSRGEWALPPESWRHVSGARILKDSGGSGWFGMDANGHDAHHGYVPTAREAAALALGPLPTPAPAAVAGEVELDWNAVRKCGGPMSGMCETQDVVRMLREYHTQLTARLAALEARR
jgi:hypothetical protein